MKMKGTVYIGYKRGGSEGAKWDYDIAIELDGLFENVYDFIKLLEGAGIEFREVRS